MITITLRLSESLLCIYRDKGSDLAETVRFEASPGITVNEVITAQGISPLLVPMVSVTTSAGQERIEKGTRLEKDTRLTLYGPLAGG